MSKLPAFQFYPGDWRKDPGIQALNYEERGIWFEMLCYMHESIDRGVLLVNGRVVNESMLARMLGLDKQNLTTALTNILDFGVASRREQDAAIYCRRMVRDEKIRQARKRAGKLGGNPNLLKQKDIQTVNQKDNQAPKQKQTPSSSSSSSTPYKIISKRLVDIFKEECSSLPSPKNISDGRCKRILARFKDLDDDDTAWREFCQRIEKSDFLTGRSNGASFGIDWVMKPDNFAKITEGNYDNKQQSAEKPKPKKIPEPPKWAAKMEKHLGHANFNRDWPTILPGDQRDIIEQIKYVKL